VVIALGVQVLLGTLGVAIGLSAINPAEEADPLWGIGTGAGIWWILTSVIALFLGGMVAGRLSGLLKGGNAGLQGAATWAVVTLLGLVFASSAVGVVVGGTWNAATTAMSQAGSAVAYVLPEDIPIPPGTWDTVRAEAEELLNERGIDLEEDQPADPDEIVEALRALLNDKPKNILEVSEQEMEEVVDVLVRRTDLTRQEARQKVSQWIEDLREAYREASQAAQRMYRSARESLSEATETAEEYAGEAIDVAANAAWWSFLMLLLSLVSAAAGGVVGVTSRDKW
jgi:polyhydroxyalkanoate synthesis regulator phasin